MYEVYALKYGERDTTACQFFYREASHESITLHYYVWLILGGPHPILVDTGFLDDDARERGIRSYVSPAAMVERAGVKPGDVPVALITHLHYDHWAGHSLFPGAEYWIQRDEVDRKSTRLNSSHSQISYAVFCLKKKKTRSRRQHLRPNSRLCRTRFA